jgi:hypothetical protein
MEVQKDFRELLALFNEHKVEYVIVGGFFAKLYSVGLRLPRPDKWELAMT